MRNLNHRHTLPMRCLPLVGSLQIYVSCAKEPYKRDLCYANETYILKESTDRIQAIFALPGIGYLGPPRVPPLLVFHCRLAYIYMCVCTYSYSL